MDKVLECEDKGDDHEDYVDNPGNTNKENENVQAETNGNSPGISGLSGYGRNEKDWDVHT